MPAKPKAFWYAETPGRCLKVVARLTPAEIKVLRRFAREFDCLCMDSATGHPIPSPRALVQAIACGVLTVAPAKTAPPSDPKTPPPPASPRGCPSEKD